MQDFPEYVIRPNAIRLGIPSFLATAILAFVFYLGILLNTALLGMDIPSSINVLIISILVLMTVIQALLTYIRVSKTRYLVYKNRVQVEGQKQGYVMFNIVQDVKHRRGPFDSLFNTGTILLGNTKLTGIPNFGQTLAYITQMVQYSRTQYSVV